MDKKLIVEAKGLSFIYPEAKIPALHEINLQICEGEYVGITGASGAGKTTLSMALCGAIPHLLSGTMTGEVIVDGLNTKETTIAELVRHVGVVMQDPESQLFSLSVFADVTFGLENLKFSREEIIQRAEWALKVVGMYEFKDRPSASLSGGQKQRVALACTLALGSKIIILDEPTSELDPIGTEEVFQVLRSLREQGLTVVVVEQKVEELVQFVDRLVYIQNGHILLDAPPREFFERTRQTYLAGDLDIFTPQVTALAYELSTNGYGFEPLPLDEREFINAYQRVRRAS